MPLVRVAPLAALAVLVVLPAFVPSEAQAQSRVIEAPAYVDRPSSRARVVERYVEDEPRVVRRRNLGGGFVEEIFGDDEPRVERRRIPTQRERAAARRGARMDLDGGYDRYGYERYERYDGPRVLYGREYRRYDYDYDEPYETREPEVTPRRLAGPPSAAGSGAVRRTVDPRFARTTVAYQGRESAGSIVIDTRARYLYLVQGDGTAIRYGVGVGREGFSWKGVEKISAKKEWPDWRPPAEMRQRRPELPVMMAGGPDNPLGARALYLGNTLYRIHGSNEPWTIGQAVSSGCIRMTNEDVTDLYERVGVGTSVKVI